MDSKTGVRFPVKARNFPFLQSVKTGSWAQPASCRKYTKKSLSGVKWPGREADHTPQSSIQVKNEWSYTYNPPSAHDFMACKGTTVPLAVYAYPLLYTLGLLQ
jgi:hypothetical protein